MVLRKHCLSSHAPGGNGNVFRTEGNLMKILVIGGAGYIGSHVCHAFADRGDNVAILDNFSSGSRKNGPSETEIFEGDILDQKFLVDVFKHKWDGVVHLAAVKAAGESMIDPGKYAVNNICGTINILNAAVKADVYENFTDVDSVYAMDPRIVPNAPAINLMTYREMRELAYAGFGVFHDEAIVPAVHAEIPICIKNTNCPEAPGTMIVPTRSNEERVVVGISSADGFCAIYIDKYMMNREIGFGRRLLQILEEEGISFEHTPSGIDNLSVVLKSDQLSNEKEALVIGRINTELEPDKIVVEHGLALIMVVGEGMHYAIGLAARATKALGDAGVNIEMINQGASEISVMFGVKASDRKKSVHALGKEFFG